MKTTARIAILAALLALPSCAGLAGTSVSFTEKGFTITPPMTPIVFPVK
jgi:hypothetical protein